MQLPLKQTTFAVDLIETKDSKTLENVFLIDDDHISCEIIKLMNNSYKCFDTIKIYNDSILALEIILKLDSQQLPNLILLDVEMPLLSGWTFLEILTKNKTLCNIPVIVLSSSILQSDRERALNYPQVVEYLSKPFPFDSCHELIKKVNVLQN